MDHLGEMAEAAQVPLRQHPAIRVDRQIARWADPLHAAERRRGTLLAEAEPLEREPHQRRERVVRIEPGDVGSVDPRLLVGRRVPARPPEVTSGLWLVTYP